MFGRISSPLIYPPSTRHFSITRNNQVEMGCSCIHIQHDNDSALLPQYSDWRQVPSLPFDIPSKLIPPIRHLSFPPPNLPSYFSALHSLLLYYHRQPSSPSLPESPESWQKSATSFLLLPVAHASLASYTTRLAGVS